ncbi:hypothetical protein ARGLB_032_00530 [Arthrobacter globiformis NBRC 12137]|uniref:Uncharacterized protein n=1 Tax=Arthrobacter globiformis (strain ATCC 8010 / DSM 20124 / JCM 1332 / NBRC 12137 / NCIMB 8907 / NRRL B-2979 / 168) TaxID=1077972 RepID=H0QJK6_ARTG1|nr:hypothetical protein [Arthrobacter globiformis]GAB13007.1 hypothetical protein ARGLB_032_00530 [Arthrobacter globiformis NBRC 12137]
MIAAAVPAGILVPEALLFTDWFRFMAAFVAVNTVMYAALALAKVLPKLQPPDWRRGQRSEPRGIYPDGQAEPGLADAEYSREEVSAGSREP